MKSDGKEWVNAWEYVPVANKTEATLTSKQIEETKRQFSENIALLVDEFGGKSQFGDAVGVSSQTLGNWLKNGTSILIDAHQQGLKRIGIADPDELLSMPLEKVRRVSPSFDVSLPGAPSKSEIEKRIEVLLRSPFRLPLQMAINLMYDELAEMDSKN